MDRVVSSKTKLQSSKFELQNLLACSDHQGWDQHVNNDDNTDNITDDALNSAQIKVKSDNDGDDGRIKIHPCISPQETVGYRCKCTFQIIQGQQQDVKQQDCVVVLGAPPPPESSKLSFQYATRCDGAAIPIQSFPVASAGIQFAMDALIEYFNDKNKQQQQLASPFLTSATFESSWNTVLDYEDNANKDDANNHGNGNHHLYCKQGSCWIMITLHYSAPIENPEEWKRDAHDMMNAWKQMQQQGQLVVIVGRSKKRVTMACSNDAKEDEVGAIAGSDGILTLTDTLWYLAPSTIPRDRPSVSLYNNKTRQFQCGSETVPIPISFHYRHQFSSSATSIGFRHANPRVMVHALEWIMEQVIQLTDNKKSSSMTLLELYCGMGAHTLPLATLNVLNKIIAIELDARLIKAFQTNVQRQQHSMTPIEIVQSDANAWALDWLKQRNCRKEETHNGDHDHDPQFNRLADILLVDPPRMGLGTQVCELALWGGFQEMLYISCGREALLQDLKILMGLHNDAVQKNEYTHFEVIDCQLLDLFPGTDSIETLVHLRRIVS